MGQTSSKRQRDIRIPSGTTAATRNSFICSIAIIGLVITAAGCGSSHSGGTGGGGSTTPTITALSTSSGTVGTAVTISGASFGATQAAGSATVTFGGVAAPVIVWSDTSILADVPSGLTAGMVNVTVTVSGTASNNEAFLLNSGTTTTCQHGNESLLSGPYAYSLRGFATTNGVTTARVGSFTANGSGGIQLATVNTSDGGEEDLNVSTNGNVHHHILASGSSYSIGPDHRGCMVLAFDDSTSVTLRFSVGAISSGVATRGHIIEFDDTSGTGSRASGIFVQQTASAFAVSQLATSFAMGLDGVDGAGAHVSMGGSFTLLTGAISNGYFDYSAGDNILPFGASGTNGVSFGHIVTTLSTLPTGRTTAQFTAGTVNTTTYTFNLAVYLVNANQFLVMTTDTLGANTPIALGRALAAPTTFTTASATGGYVVESTGVTGGAASTVLEQFNFAPAGPIVSETGWKYGLGTGFVNTPSGSPSATGGIGYAVSAQGRVTFTGGLSAVVYLTTAEATTDNIAGIVVGTDASTYHGLMIPQATAGFTGNAQVFFGTVNPGDPNVSHTVGVAGFGAASGNAVTGSGTQDQSQVSGLSSITFANTVFTFQSSTGLGTATDTSGDTFVCVGFGSGFVYIEENTTSSPKRTAAITFVQQ